MEKSIKSIAESSLQTALKALKDFDLELENNVEKRKPNWSKLFRGLAKIFEGVADVFDALKGKED